MKKVSVIMSVILVYASVLTVFSGCSGNSGSGSYNYNNNYQNNQSYNESTNNSIVGTWKSEEFDFSNELIKGFAEGFGETVDEIEKHFNPDFEVVTTITFGADGNAEIVTSFDGMSLLELQIETGIRTYYISKGETVDDATIDESVKVLRDSINEMLDSFTNDVTYSAEDGELYLGEGRYTYTMSGDSLTISCDDLETEELIAASPLTFERTETVGFNNNNNNNNDVVANNQTQADEEDLGFVSKYKKYSMSDAENSVNIFIRYREGSLYVAELTVSMKMKNTNFAFEDTKAEVESVQKELKSLNLENMELTDLESSNGDYTVTGSFRDLDLDGRDSARDIAVKFLDLNVGSGKISITECESALQASGLSLTDSN